LEGSGSSFVAPGFGAGAVGGYAVLRVDPAIVAPEPSGAAQDAALDEAVATPASSSDDVRDAFGG